MKKNILLIIVTAATLALGAQREIAQKPTTWPFCPPICSGSK